MKKPSNNKVRPITGWFLIAREELDGDDLGDWYIAWSEAFSSKRRALDFATKYGWCKPYRAVRGQITVQP